MDGPIIKLLIVGETSFSHSSLHFILKHCCFVLGGLGGDAHLGLVLKDVTSMSARPSPSRLPLYSHCMQ